MFWVKNNTIIEWLRTAIQNDDTTQTILKEMGQGDIKGFIQKDKFLLF